MNYYRRSDYERTIKSYQKNFCKLYFIQHAGLVGIQPASKALRSSRTLKRNLTDWLNFCLVLNKAEITKGQKGSNSKISFISQIFRLFKGNPNPPYKIKKGGIICGNPIIFNFSPFRNWSLSKLIKSLIFCRNFYWKSYENCVISMKTLLNQNRQRFTENW